MKYIIFTLNNLLKNFNELIKIKARSVILSGLKSEGSRFPIDIDLSHLTSI